jgi:hypothetical protein
METVLVDPPRAGLDAEVGVTVMSWLGREGLNLYKKKRHAVHLHQMHILESFSVPLHRIHLWLPSAKDTAAFVLCAILQTVKLVSTFPRIVYISWSVHVQRPMFAPYMLTGTAAQCFANLCCSVPCNAWSYDV